MGGMLGGAGGRRKTHFRRLKSFRYAWKKFSHILLTIKCNCWRREREGREEAAKAEVAQDDPEMKVATYA